MLGSTCDVPHGYTSCVMLPTPMRYNQDVNPDRHALVAKAMEHPGRPAWEVLHKFMPGLGLPRSRAAVGATEEKFETVAQAALLDHYLHTHPKPIGGIGDIMEILRMAA